MYVVDKSATVLVALMLACAPLGSAANADSVIGHRITTQSGTTSFCGTQTFTAKDGRPREMSVRGGQAYGHHPTMGDILFQIVRRGGQEYFVAGGGPGSKVLSDSPC